MSIELVQNNETILVNEIKQSTLKTATKTGLQELITDITKELSLKDFESQTDIPIPIEMIPYGESVFSINKDVSSMLDLMVEAINDEEHPLEFPFALLGDSQELSIYKRLFSNFEELNSIRTDFVSEKVAILYKEVSNSDKLNTIVVSHTHPKIPESLQEDILTKKVSQTLKEKYHIKDIGLNLSLMDLYQLESLHKQMGDKVNILLGVLLYNGDFVLVQKTENGFQRVRHNKD